MEGCTLPPLPTPPQMKREKSVSNIHTSHFETCSGNVTTIFDGDVQRVGHGSTGKKFWVILRYVHKMNPQCKIQIHLHIHINCSKHIVAFVVILFNFDITFTLAYFRLC